DGAPPFIWGLGISFTSPTLDGPTVNSTGKRSLFAQSRFPGGPPAGFLAGLRSALDGGLDLRQRRGHPRLELVGVDVVAPERERREHPAERGQLLRYRTTVDHLGAGPL